MEFVLTSYISTFHLRNQGHSREAPCRTTIVRMTNKSTEIPKIFRAPQASLAREFPFAFGVCGEYGLLALPSEKEEKCYQVLLRPYPSKPSNEAVFISRLPCFSENVAIISKPGRYNRRAVKLTYGRSLVQNFHDGTREDVYKVA